ncbi:SGNH/GDSL hydrolase family protein [Acetivibrio cellulolyticus]|uniref:SGNH/GDSL hydrolase family protein n=1 Tax=Acetivibrio cellulolyticus TaxID=35830 RepID=UPI0001E2F0D2|nr:SGNH/GDSL hydrolase family protein [Acetivibrio cellulolyticus]
MLNIKNMSKALAAIFIFTLILSSTAKVNVTAAATSYKFDFGGDSVASGFTGVSASTAYSKTLGYGFNTPENMKNVTASGSGELSDAVQFITYGVKSTNTFNVDLSNGLYEVKVALGNTSRSSVAAEGVFQIINMTGNNAVDKFQIPITDGQLNILVTEGKAGTAFTLSALEITKISDNPVPNRTLWIGGDSTVCNYYPLDTSTQAGWGQLMPKYVDTTAFQVRNMAASGQCARGFRDDGQFEAIMKYIKPGDIFILEFGINDTNEKNNTTEAQFKEIMADMVTQVKAKGATMVLLAPQGRATDFSGGIHSAVNRWYRNTTIAVAKEQGVRLCDLNVLSSSYFTSIGSDATLALFMPSDTLHPNRAGATELARLVYNDLKDLFTPTVITPTFTSTPTPTSTPPSIIYGDVNGNGNVDSIDFALVRKYILGMDTPVSISNGDVNGDGSINSIDFALIRQFILGIISKFPISTSTPDSGTYEAEQATITNGVLETTNTGYSGSGYVNYNNEVGSYVEWNVNAPTSGSYKLVFRYSNGTTVSRPMSIAVNGNIVKSSMDFGTTTNWTTWSETYIVASLNQGQNFIRATGTTANGGPNVDYLKIYQTSEPVSTDSATPTPAASAPPTSEGIPTVYLAGDSTVQSYNSSYYPQAGWGQMIYNYFTPDVYFVNKAIAGRSSKSFVVDGRLDEILNVIKKDDYLFIQFGHNDATISNPERYAAPYTTYKEYLAKYIDGAREKGAIPILITPVARLNYNNGTYKNDFPDYCTAMKQVADEKNCAIIDLMTKSLDYYATLDYNTVYKFYMVSSNGTDYTHFTETGAKEIAEIVSQSVKELNVPISKYVK